MIVFLAFVIILFSVANAHAGDNGVCGESAAHEIINDTMYTGTIDL